MSPFGTLFGRYIFLQAAGALLLILLSLTGAVWIALALRQLNLITTQGQDAWLFIKMTLLALPNLMALIAPIALLVATIHTLNRMNSDSELIVLTAAGATIWRIARPLVLLAFLVSLGVSAVNHLVMPWSLKLLRDYVIQVRTDLITQVIQPGKFSSPEANLTFHIRDREQDGDLLGLILHDARDEKKISSYLAERGQIIKQDKAAYLLMVKGHIIQRSKADTAPDIVAFERYAVDLDRFEKKDEIIELKPRERYYHELVDLDPNLPNYKLLVGPFRAELHERFASPLYPFAFVLVAVAIVGQAKTTRQNRIQSIVTAFGIAAACRLAGLAATNIVSLRASALWLLYGIPVIAVVLALIGAHLGMQPRRASRLGTPADWAADFYERAATVLTRRRRPQPAGAGRTGRG